MVCEGGKEVGGAGLLLLLILKGESPTLGWSQAKLRIAANYLHMCCSGRNIQDPLPALCILHPELGYCGFIRANEDKKEKKVENLDRHLQDLSELALMLNSSIAP